MIVAVDFSIGSLFASLLIGSVGWVLFIYGKRQERWPQIIVGVLLMVYPYFISNVMWMGGIAVALVVGLKLALQSGL